MNLLDRFKKKKAEPGKQPAEKPKNSQSATVSKQVGVSIDKEENKVTKDASPEKVKKAVKGDTGDSYKVLIKPLLTEKSSNAGILNQYSFKVSIKTNKIEIKKAVQKLYGVTVVKVNVMNMGGKKITYGRTKGVTKNWKKALVTLKNGEKIEIYEGI